MCLDIQKVYLILRCRVIYSPKFCIRPLNSSATDLIYGTYIGGSDDDYAYGIALDAAGNAYVGGTTGSSDFPSTPKAFDATYNGYGDGFLVQLNNTGSAVDYASFLGGSDIDFGYDVAVDGTGKAYVTGLTMSSDFPTTPAAYDTSYNGNGDAFVITPGVSICLFDDQSWAPCECPFGCSTGYTGWEGGPINTRTGNYHLSEQDISIPALGQPLRFERGYSAQAVGLYTSTLGYGWTHNYDMNLILPDDPGGEPDTLIVKGCRGSRFRFGDNGDGTYGRI